MHNVLKRDLKDGKQTFGVWVTIPHNDVAECLSRLAFDWFVFDQEHSPLDDQLSQQLMQAMGGAAVTPLVRVACNDPVLYKESTGYGSARNHHSLCQFARGGGARRSVCLYPPPRNTRLRPTQRSGA